MTTHLRKWEQMEWTPEAVERVFHLRRSGKNMTQIAKDIGTTPRAVRGKLRRIQKADNHAQG